MDGESGGSLTDEQRERIQRNRERALEIQRRRKLEAQQTSQEEAKRRKVTPRKRQSKIDTQDDKEDTDVELEEFEKDASAWVTKKEAMKVYCLPEGTLAVCACEEKANPRNKGWTPMKLYNRAEIRRRARERFGGLQGLIDERRAREEKAYERDLLQADKVFK
jgi:hypothetical protein